jgi:hypothetical protein
MTEFQEKPTIYQRMNQIMGEVDYVQKEKKPGMRYSIVPHDKVTSSIRPTMVKYGVVYHPQELVVSQNGNRTEVRMTVRFACTDDPSFIDVPTVGYGIDDQDKGPGKAISYAVKYALLKAFGLETGDEPEEDQTTEHVNETGKQLKALIEGATRVVDLEEDVLPKIQDKIFELTAPQQALVRSQYRQKLNKLEGKK